MAIDLAYRQRWETRSSASLGLWRRRRSRDTMRCTCRAALLLSLVAHYRVHSATLATAQHSDNDASSSLAFCITGEVRTFARDAETIKSHVVQSMTVGGCAHAVFAVLGPVQVDDREKTLKALALLNASDVQLLAAGEEPAAPPQPKCEVRQMAKAGPSFHQWDKLRRCYGLVQKFEQGSRGGREFDFLVRIRPDKGWSSMVRQSGIVFEDAVSFLRYAPRSSLVDYFFVAPRKYAAVACSASEAYAHCFTAEELQAVQQCQFRSRFLASQAVFRGTECLLHLWLRWHKVPMAQMEAFSQKPFRAEV